MYTKHSKGPLYHRNSVLCPTGVSRLVLTVAWLLVPAILVLGTMALVD